MQINKFKLFVTGHTGLLGNSLMRLIDRKKYSLVLNNQKLDLTDNKICETFFKTHKPDYVINLAAKVGGIRSNLDNKETYLNKNTFLQLNIINCCWKYKIKKLINIGSNCIYPRNITRNIREKDLLKGELEETNEGYALAKILGVKLCQYYNQKYNTEFLTLMPANLYGPFDNYKNESSHVVPALIKKICSAKKRKKNFIEIWGSGRPIRDFLFVDDCSKAIIFFLEKNCKDLIKKKNIHYINIGSGIGTSITNLATMIKNICGYKGKFTYNTQYPDGHKRKVLDINLAKKLGFNCNSNLKKNLTSTISWFILNKLK
jgi:GDP-L-fucose synthase